MITLKTYWLWTAGPSDFPSAANIKSSETVDVPQAENQPQPLVGTEIIISKNLFDPERGAGMTREAEANTTAFQRIRAMVLLGTAIIGNNRFAILQDGGNTPARPGVTAPPAVPMRVKVGDTVDGFQLSEIADKRVVFTRGPAKVELALDYFRKPDLRQPSVAASGKTPPPSAVAPRVIPNLPRRLRPQTNPDAGPNS